MIKLKAGLSLHNPTLVFQIYGEHNNNNSDTN